LNDERDADEAGHVEQVTGDRALGEVTHP
jgi:hypothetical protein